MSNYVDITAIMQVIGCVFNNPQLLDFTDKYTITEEDFVSDFHKIVFGSIYKIHEMGVKEINLNLILRGYIRKCIRLFSNSSKKLCCL